MSLIYQAPVVFNSNNNKKTANSTTATTKTTTTKPRPGIYIGDKNDAKNYKQLIQRNITYILNVTPPKEACYKTGVPNYFEQRPNHSIESSNSQPSPTFHYLRIPIYDSAISMTQLLDSIPTICTFVNQAIQYNQSSILIHCQRGISRSVTVAILYMIRCLDMSYHDAITIIQRRRPQAQPIPEFVTILQEFEITCRLPTFSLKHVPTITTTINTSTDNSNITDGTGTTNNITVGDDVTTLGTTATNVSKPKVEDNDDDDDQNHRNMSKTNTGSKRIVGPQRPPLPTNMTIPTTSANAANDGSVAVDENGRHKRRKLNQIVGPQRPPST